jgi:hypothetical protein
MTNGLNNKTSRKDMKIWIIIASIVIAYVLFVRKDRKPQQNAGTHFQHKQQLKQQLKQRQWKNQHQS